MIDLNANNRHIKLKFPLCLREVSVSIKKSFRIKKTTQLEWFLYLILRVNYITETPISSCHSQRPAASENAPTLKSYDPGGTPLIEIEVPEVWNL